MQQALSFRGWCAFASVFSLATMLGADVLARIFVDSSNVVGADGLGGLTREEFHEAVVRAALLAEHRKGTSDGRARRVRESEGVAALEPLGAAERLVGGLRLMCAQLETAVRRATNAGHERQSPRSGACAGARSVSTNYHLLMEGAREFQHLTDHSYRTMRQSAQKRDSLGLLCTGTENYGELSTHDLSLSLVGGQDGAPPQHTQAMLLAELSKSGIMSG